MVFLKGYFSEGRRVCIRNYAICISHQQRAPKMFSGTRIHVDTEYLGTYREWLSIHFVRNGWAVYTLFGKSIC